MNTAAPRYLRPAYRVLGDLLFSVFHNEDSNSQLFEVASALNEVIQQIDDQERERLANDPVLGGICKGCGVRDLPFGQCLTCGAPVEPIDGSEHYCWGRWRAGADCFRCGGTGGAASSSSSPPSPQSSDAATEVYDVYRADTEVMSGYSSADA